MAFARFLWLTAAVFAVLAVSAEAAKIPVLSPNGTVHERAQPGVAARGPERPSAHRQVRVAQIAARRTPLSELERMYAAGQITADVYDNARRTLVDAKRFTKTLSGRREAEMNGQLDVLKRIAAAGELTPSRVNVLFLQLARNREWWGKGALLSAGARVGFGGSQLVYQYFPGEGLQFHPLANFGKLNALWTSHSDLKMVEMMNELLALPAERAGGLAWEYYFDFDGGEPPWTSSLSQGTALQSLARASTRAGTFPQVLPLLQRGLAIFQVPPPAGVMTRADGGMHFVQYSFAPDLRILNGFVQSITGLYDFAQLSGDPTAQALFAQGDAAAQREIPTYNTGAWSLYSRGSITRESDLGYHDLLTTFLNNMCKRTAVPVYCDTAADFTAYEDEDPAVSLLTTTVRRKRANVVRFKLSKIARVNVVLQRGGVTVLNYNATLGYGTRSVNVTPPAGAKAYAVRITATDLAGNGTSTNGTIKIVK